MKHYIVIAALTLGLGIKAQTKPISKTTSLGSSSVTSKQEQDRALIKSMAGAYKVSFNFAETFATDTGYKYYPRYAEWGIEQVIVVEDRPDKIVLQHLLVVRDSIIIKHWRQDWVYENTDLYKYNKDNEWIRETLTVAKAKGTWTQKVYQVDDSPRYESYGTWVNVDGKNFWEGTNDAPLPRREYSNRDDYNVMKRHSRMEILSDGWMLEQDNEKIVRDKGSDKTICWEKGIERFTKGDYNTSAALKWWEKQQQYWADVRTVWHEVYNKTPDLKLASIVNDKRLYQSLFDLGDKMSSENNYLSANAIADIKKVIEAYLKKA